VADALIIVGLLVVAGASLVFVAALCAAASKPTPPPDDSWQHDAETLAVLTSERARQAMRDRLLHARMRSVRDHRHE